MSSTVAAPAARVLVTGAAGFIGSHLVDRLLTDGSEIVAVDDLSTGRLSNLAEASRHPAFRFEELDIVSSDFRTLVGDVQPDVVMHLAAQMDVRKSVADPLHDARINVLGTVNVAGGGHPGRGTKGRLRQQRWHRLRRAGRAARLGGRTAAAPSPYGAAKVAGEVYMRTYQRLHGLGASLALGNVYGPGRTLTVKPVS